MYLIAIAWLYVVLMMAVAEALSPQGTVLGAIITLVFYGLLPMSVVLYIVGTPMRRRARLAAEAAQAAETAPAGDASAAAPGAGTAPAASAGAAAFAASVTASVTASATASGTTPDGGSHAAGDAIAPERKEV